ncbi:hypothetical protein, partial [Rhizobium sp. PP-F2F-G48]|uniref:hypothetical protein n=1 Tax=Rhizobium sp. PP-F2F-G48 TaxID=2135651 RepID=UPI001A9E20EE
GMRAGSQVASGSDPPGHGDTFCGKAGDGMQSLRSLKIPHFGTCKSFCRDLFNPKTAKAKSFSTNR